MNFKNIMAAVAATAAAWALAGCGATPGNAEVREALRTKAIAFLEQVNGRKATAKDLGEIDADLETVKVVACKKADPMNGFNCDWTGGEKFAMIAGGSRRFLKTDAGWMLATAGQ
jgi:hypothetical protein